MNEILLMNSIRLLISGYLNDGGDIENVPDILIQIRHDYAEAIKENSKASDQI